VSLAFLKVFYFVSVVKIGWIISIAGKLRAVPGVNITISRTVKHYQIIIRIVSRDHMFKHFTRHGMGIFDWILQTVLYLLIISR